ncbi:Phospholipase B-like [Gryllus bimaculatus]|nr:Phospholipase B-like [Gryllus bimaculatus]
MASTAVREIVFLGITFLLFSLSRASTKYYTVQYVTLDESKGAQIHTADVTNFEDVPANWVAKAIFDNQINKTGWSFLELQSNGQATDEDQVYAAGVLEGYVTSELIYEHWFNTMKGFCDGREKTCRRIQKYLDKNNQWIKANIDSKEKKDPYWYQVKLFYIQLKGIKDGYNRGIKDASKHLKLNDLFYQNMLRVEKLYILPLRRLAGSPARVPGVAMSFSSYPGIITSGDDFYIMSSGLVTLETTIGVNNDSLWKFVRPSQKAIAAAANVLLVLAPVCVRALTRDLKATGAKGSRRGPREDPVAKTSLPPHPPPPPPLLKMPFAIASARHNLAPTRSTRRRRLRGAHPCQPLPSLPHHHHRFYLPSPPLLFGRPPASASPPPCTSSSSYFHPRHRHGRHYYHRLPPNFVPHRGTDFAFHLYASSLSSSSSTTTNHRPSTGHY